MIKHSGMAVAYLSPRDSRRNPGMYIFWNSPYNYRLFDRYACPIASLAVLADGDGWKPNYFDFEVLGCKHHIQFPVVKLSELADQTEALDTHRNPFALVTAAHLRTRQTRHDS
jgi:hypothetical protein